MREIETDIQWPPLILHMRAHTLASMHIQTRTREGQRQRDKQVELADNYVPDGGSYGLCVCEYA